MRSISLRYLAVPCLIAYIGLSGCSSLEEEVYSSIFTDNFYQTSLDAEAALYSSYGSLSELFNGPVATTLSDWCADQIYPRSVVGRNTLTLFSYEPTYATQKSFNRVHEGPYGLWQASYKGIETANWVIDRVPAIVMDDQRKNVILGEAYFLRAYYHWLVTKNFGDVIIKTKPSASESDAIVGKSHQAEVYNQIFEDLDKAIGMLPVYSAGLRKGSPCKEAAQALYAKAALYQEKWAESLQKAEEVINSGGLSLLPNVLDVYDVEKEDDARVENIWAFEGESTNPGRWSFMMSKTGPPNGSGVEYGNTSTGAMFAYQDFFNSFSPADARRQLLDTTYLNRAGVIVPQRNITPITPHGVLIRKFRDPKSIGEANRSNVPILRLADIYLVAAEAEAHLNGATSKAYAYINTVRNRANLADLEQGLDKNTFLEAVLQERSWELFGEGDRWYDLVRTGKFVEVVSKAVNDVYPVRPVLAKHKYFPIPQDELDANPKLEQNPDWQ